MSASSIRSTLHTNNRTKEPPFTLIAVVVVVVGFWSNVETSVSLSHVDGWLFFMLHVPCMCAIAMITIATFLHFGAGCLSFVSGYCCELWFNSNYAKMCVKVNASDPLVQNKLQIIMYSLICAYLRHTHTVD